MSRQQPAAKSDGVQGKRAAMYVRMSSRPQDHSIEHQCARLEEYAEERGIVIVKMYADSGKSGLRINGRDGMQELIEDVQTGSTGFELVLVYDVSRWGRFQDTDEGAHYEYLCRQAGIQVIYCAEPFENDGSAIASILKGMKRTMAAEYSRELSAKVFAAQCRFAAQGYKMGGYAGYGLRRVSFDKNGQKRRVLSSGERKGAATDRVRFCWGPQKEIDTIRQIYAWYVEDKLGDTAIAAKLNALKVKSEWRRPWTPAQVKTILTNEKYVGRIMFNRGSAKMSTARHANPANDWICIDDDLPAIVAPQLFKKAVEERLRRNRDKTDNELLAMLRSLYKKHGKVTVSIIIAAKGVPNPKYFGARFGSLAEAYQAAGLPAAKPLLRAKTLRAVRQLREATMSSIKLAIEQASGAHEPCQHPWLLRINGQLDLKLVVARARHDPAGYVRWRIPILTSPVPGFVLCVQMDAANAGVLGYYLFPVADFTQAHIVLRAEYPDEKEQYRYPSLASMFGLVD
ncbi:recombinase family protein [Duganella sp. BuS-21]|jgi:DNA invertase Pin-like site-specific DNA recombinase|uniref:recombinase family protein n=1 Tax=Duganella sp. BuS-21 TaxID=2943848 RepID=UPI0035A6D044